MVVEAFNLTLMSIGVVAILVALMYSLKCAELRSRIEVLTEVIADNAIYTKDVEEASLKNFKVALELGGMCKDVVRENDDLRESCDNLHNSLQAQEIAKLKLFIEGNMLHKEVVELRAFKAAAIDIMEEVDYD